MASESATALASTSTVPNHGEAQPLLPSQPPALLNEDSVSLSAGNPNDNAHEPALSQAPSSTPIPAPRIFVYPDGTAIPIFVEANGVSNNRPKLVRSLKRHAADIVHDPADARIILVEPVSKEGRYFVREWQADAGKTVLDVAWAAASVERGHALMQEDQYGGFGNLSGEDMNDDEDDFSNVSKKAGDQDEEEMEVEKSVTPAKLKRKKNKDVNFFAGSNSLPSSSNANSSGATIAIGSSRETPDYVASPRNFSISSRSDTTNSSTAEVNSHASGQRYEFVTNQRPASAPKSAAVVEARRSSAQESQPRPPIDRKRSDFVTPGLPTPPGTSSSASIDISSYRFAGGTASPSPSQNNPSSFPQSAYSQPQYQPYQTFPSQPYDTSADSLHHYSQSQFFSQPPQLSSSQFPNQLALVDRRSPQDVMVDMQQHMDAFARMPPAIQQYWYMQMQGAQMPRALPAPPGFITPSPTATLPTSTWMGAPHAHPDQVFDYNGLQQQNFQQTPSRMNGFGGSGGTPTQPQQPHSLSPPPGPPHSITPSIHGRLHTPPPSSFSISSQELENEPETPPIAILERGRSSSSKGKKRSYEMMDEGNESESSLGFSTSQRHSKKSSKKHQSKDVSTSDPLSSQPSLPPSQKKPPIGIFTAGDGSPMKFFYQLITKDREGKRMSHIGKIKANGGSITAELHDATFIILAPQSPLYFDNLKKECIALDRIALKSSFIDACLEEGAIVNEEDFELDLSETSPVKKAKGRPSTHTISFPRDKAVTSANEEIPPDLLESLPVPPPPELFCNGSNKYTDAERIFVLESAAIIFRKYPGVSNKRLFAIIGERCTSHSAGSWKNQVSRAWAADLERVRRMVKEGVPAEVLKQNGWSDSQVAPRQDDVHAQGEDDDDVQEIPAPEREFTADELETDLQNITNYFAVEPEGDDEQLWVDLAEKHECVTAQSWQEFYQTKQEEVNRRLRTALGIDKD